MQVTSSLTRCRKAISRFLSALATPDNSLGTDSDATFSFHLLHHCFVSCIYCHCGLGSSRPSHLSSKVTCCRCRIRGRGCWHVLRQVRGNCGIALARVLRRPSLGHATLAADCIPHASRRVSTIRSASLSCVTSHPLCVLVRRRVARVSSFLAHPIRLAVVAGQGLTFHSSARATHAAAFWRQAAQYEDQLWLPSLTS